MKLRVMVIPADEQKGFEVKELDGVDHLSAVARELGGYVHLIHTRSLGERHQVMMVDEDGLLKGLEPNARAMKYSRFAGIIVGDAYITGHDFRGIENTLYFTDFNGPLTPANQE